MTLSIVALLCRLVVAFTFAAAGLTKMARLEESRKAVHEFGLPLWAANPVGTVLPFAELAIAALLFPVYTLLWGSLGAVALLLGFIVAIAINLSLGRKPECNCFGQVHSEPIGWSTLVRNAVLVAAATLVVWNDWRGSPISIIHSLANLSLLALAFTAVVVFGLFFASAAAWLAFHLLRQNGRLLLRMDALEDQLNGRQPAPDPDTARAHVGPPLGSPAPYFELPRLEDGTKVTLHTLMAAKKTVALIFSDPHCGPCFELLPQIAGWERDYADTLTIAMISRGKPEANREKFAPHSLRYVLLQKDREVAAKFQANGTPAAILISPDGTVASELAMGAPAIINLIAAGSKLQDLKSSAGANGNGNVRPSPAVQQPQDLPIGTFAPNMEFPDLQDNIVNLSKASRTDTLILFWNPACGFCARMLQDLKQWEANRPDEAPRLLVVSTGSVESNRAMGLESVVVLDQNFAAGRAFHVRGTPSAVLLDGQGRIASGVMVGSPTILKSLENHLPNAVLS